MKKQSVSGNIIPIININSCRKIRFFFIFIAFFQTFAWGSKAQATKISLNLSNATLEEVVHAIEAKTPFVFFLNNSEIDMKKRVNLTVKDVEIKEIMEQIFPSYRYHIENYKIVVLADENQKSIRIKGKIIDRATEMPVIGANIIVKGTTVGSITDMDGNFTLEASIGSTLQVTYIGYVSQEITVNKSEYVIRLVENTENLEEVVVIGYGTSRKRDIVSAMSNVKGKTISSASSSNIQDILQGKVAGLDVQAARYAGDSEQKIYIRGARSLNAGNTPLVIIDGIPGSLGNVNTYDIESIEILKDAASSAIYGSMGANGVIMVTTKRGKKGVHREVNFNSYIGVNVPHMMALQSGEEYVQFRRDGYRYAHGWDNPFTDEDVFTQSELDIIKSGNYTDWQDLMYRNALIQSYYLSVSNSGEKTRLSLSFKYDKEEGYHKTNDSQNYNLTFTADHDLANFWTIGSTIRLKRNNTSGFKTYNNELLYMTPLSKPYLENGDLNYFPNPLNTSGYNPLADIVPGQFADDAQSNILNLNLTSDIRINKWLSMRTNFGYIFSDYKRGYFYGKNSYSGKGVKTTSGKDYNNYDQYTLNHIVTYDNTFGRHNIIVNLVGEIQSRKYDKSGLSGDNQPVEYTTYHNLGTNTENIKIGSEYENWALASGLGRLRYNYGDKYYFNIAFRADGSSRLAKGNKWAFFPSGGIAWSIKDENFMQKAEWLNTLKVRLSYGTVGNTAITPYQTQAVLSKYAYLFGEDAGNKYYVYNPRSIINLDLGWEISRTINAGIDFGIFNNKLNGYVEVYRTKTSDLLMKRTIPSFTGFSDIWQNIGKTETSGVEWNLNYSPVRTKDLNIDLFFNASRNWEKVVELISGEDLPNNRWFIGEPLGVFYDYEKTGVWQLGEEEEAAKYNAAVGDIKVKDQNDDSSISAADDRVILGQVRPKWLVSFGGNIQYKNFDFSFNLNSRWGYLVKPAPYDDITMDGQRWLPSVDYWTPDNPTNNYSRADQASGYDTYRTSNGYQKGDHIKLQDITLGYSFENLLSNKIPIRKLRFYVQMRNVGYLYKAADFDIIPEQPNINYTVPTSYNFGLNVTF